MLPSEIFKAYDIRGIVGKTLTEEIAQQIGHAIGSEAVARKQTTIAIGRDGRLSGPALSQALAQGIMKSGINVVDIGMVATPMSYFAAHHLQCKSAVMVTGSHNPPDYNGFKIVIGEETLSGEGIQALHQRIKQNQFINKQEGKLDKKDISQAYIDRITSDIKLARPIKIIVDAGNGVAGAFAPQVYRKLGCEVIELFCNVDGKFPNHHPDPSKPENLKDVMRALKTTDAEIGFAFDGDGDRLGVVTKEGEIIYPDRQLMLFAADVLSLHPGAEIIFDVKCTRNLAPWIKQHGGKPTMWKTGHSLIKAKMKESGALLAGEMSGHTFFKERWYGFDDGIYAGARLLEILSRAADSNKPLKDLPNSIATPELNLRVAEGEQFSIVKQLQQTAQFKHAQEIIKIDGLRVEYKNGFGLARASNTTPVIVLRFEADDLDTLKSIQDDFRKNLLQIKPDANLPF